MKEYEFTVILTGSPELTDDLAERLYESGCDDATPTACENVVSIVFHRDGPSLEDAIRSAIANVQAAGCSVAKVEIDAAELSTV